MKNDDFLLCAFFFLCFCARGGPVGGHLATPVTRQVFVRWSDRAVHLARKGE